MVGLTPEQISNVMTTQAATEQMKRQTVSQAYDALYRQAATEKLQKETGLLGSEPPEQVEQWEVSEPDEFGRILRTNKLTGKTEQVSGPTPTPPLTFEQRMELGGVIKTFDWWKNPDTGDVLSVRKDKNPPKGYTQRVPSQEVQVSDIGERKFEFTRAKEARDAFQVATKQENKKNPAVKDDISFHNTYSDGTIGLIWLEKEGWFGDVGTMEVPLPKDKNGKQLTMEDIRRVAGANGVSPAEVLKQIYDAQQKK